MRKQTVIFGVLAGVIVCLAIAQPNATQTRTTNNTKAENGRWQIVNPISEVHARTFLLDTQTGDTWMICGDMLKGEAQWCPLDRVYLVEGKPVHVSPTLPAKP